MRRSSYFLPELGELNVSRNAGAAPAASSTWMDYDGSGDGSIVTIESSAIDLQTRRRIRVVALSATSVVVAYVLASNALRLVAGTVSGSAITWGTPLDVQIDTIHDFDLSAVSSSKVAVGCICSATSDPGFVKTYTVSGNVLTIDATYVFLSSGANSGDRVSIAVLSATRMMVASFTNSNGPRIRGLTIGSGTLTADGTQIATLSYYSASCLLVRKLDATRGIALFATTASEPPIVALVVTDSGSALSDGTPASFSTIGLGGYPTVAAFDWDGSSIGLCSVSRFANDGTGETWTVPISISSATITTPQDAGYNAMPWSTGFPVGSIAYMTTTGTRRDFLLAEGNLYTQTARLEACGVVDINKPRTGGVKDDIGYQFGGGTSPESMVDVAKLTTDKAIAVFTTPTNRYPATQIINQVSSFYVTSTGSYYVVQNG